MTQLTKTSNEHKLPLKQARFVRGGLVLLALMMAGCSLKGYSNTTIYPKEVSSVCVRMFDNRTFWRNIEYDLSDALSKRIEAKTPYKIISNDNVADT